jgi:small acid-soluble spore protein D (minor alpha/beta-type SASP)
MKKRVENRILRRRMTMSRSTLNPQARAALDRLKAETASEVGVKLNDGYNGDIKSRDAGQIGGNMVRKMIQSYENSAAGK